MNRPLPRLARRVLVTALAAGALLALRPTHTDVNALPAGNAETLLDEARNFDRRIEYNRGYRAPDRAVSVPSALAGVPDLDLSRDDAFGTTRTLSSLTTYLTGARPGDDAMKVALDFVSDPANLELLGLTPGDLADHEVTDVVFTRVTGATHIYLRQTYLGIPVYNGQLHVNVNRDGRILSVNNLFVPDLAQSINSSGPALGLGAAVRGAARHLGVRLDAEPRVIESAEGARQETTVDGAGLSLAPIKGRSSGCPCAGARRAWAGTSRWRRPIASITTTWSWMPTMAWSGRASTGSLPTTTASTTSPTRARTTRRRCRRPTAARCR